MPGFNYGGKGDGTNWSSERGTGLSQGAAIKAIPAIAIAIAAAPALATALNSNR